MIETVSYPGMVTSKGGKMHAVIGIDALRELFLRRWIFLCTYSLVYLEISGYSTMDEA